MLLLRGEWPCSLHKFEMKTNLQIIWCSANTIYCFNLFFSWVEFKTVWCLVIIIFEHNVNKVFIGKLLFSILWQIQVMLTSLLLFYWLGFLSIKLIRIRDLYSFNFLMSGTTRGSEQVTLIEGINWFLGLHNITLELIFAGINRCKA